MNHDPSFYDETYYRERYKKTLFHRRGEKVFDHRLWLRFLRQFAAEGGNLLEVGCGHGYFLKQTEITYRTFGVDLSAYAAGHTKRITDRTPVSIADSLFLPFKNDSFDMIIGFDMVEHLQDPETFFGEALRLLKTGGVLVMKTPNPESFGALRKPDAWHGLRDPSHASILAPAVWRDILLRQHFHLIREGTDSPWDTPYFKGVPALIQKMISFLLFDLYIIFTGNPILAWRWGENYIAISKKI